MTHLLEDLVDSLAGLRDEVFTARAAEILAVPEDWPRLVRDYLLALPPSEFRDRVLRGHIAHVVPRPFLIYDNERFDVQLLINHFDRPLFDAQVKGKTMGPHYHHRAFATRVLTGVYTQWLYDNEGAFDEPELRFAGQVRCPADSVYELQWHDWHWVLTPADDMLTLALRAPASREPQRNHPWFTDDTIGEYRNKLIALLDIETRRTVAEKLDLRERVG